MKQKSFTLIELLIVIAIIAILAGMLLPALSKAKQLPLRSTCTSNMKSISLLFFDYVDSYNNYFPFATGYGGRPVLPGLLTNVNPSVDPDNAEHLKKQKFLVCPARVMVTGYMKNFPYRFSYLFDRDRWQESISSGRVFSVVKKPTKKLLTMDHSSFGLSKHYRNLSQWQKSQAFLPGTRDFEPDLIAKLTAPDEERDTDFMTGRHNLSVMLMFLDGHVESRNSKPFTKVYYLRPGNNGSGDLFDLTN